MENGITKKVEYAEDLYNQYGKMILSDIKTKEMILDLEQVTEKRRSLMFLCGIWGICRRCEIDEGGSCCGKGIETRYDEWLLLINLLLGCSLPRKRFDVSSCFFLGKEGCILKAPHVICINYICKKIEEGIIRAELFQLRELEGKMIDIIFKLHEHLMKSYSCNGIDKKEPV